MLTRAGSPSRTATDVSDAATARRGGSTPGGRSGSHHGIKTLLMTWTTPFDAVTLGLVTIAPPTITLPPRTAIETDVPSSVLAEWSFIACAAVTLPLTTW